MSIKIIKPFKISFFALLVAVLAIFFLFKPIESQAQYYQVNSYGNYTYVDNYTYLNITTTNAGNITSSSAILNGLVNGTNLYSTYNLSAWFEYGTNPNLGYSTVHNPSNSGYANFSSTIANLNPNTIYYYRAVGQSPQGVVYGVTNSFRTNFASVNTIDNTSSTIYPTAITNPATSISGSSVKLNSLIINSADDPLKTWFEYGTSEGLGNKTEVVSIGELASAKHINTISGLAPGTTYYFRAVVENSAWRNNGSILSFTTSGAKQNSNNSVITDMSSITNNGATKKTEDTKNLTGSVLGANVLGNEAGSFLPGNLFGWLLLIILVLILALASKHLYGQFGKQKQLEPQEHAH